jgi:hypothetical protein
MAAFHSGLREAGYIEVRMLRLLFTCDTHKRMERIAHNLMGKYPGEWRSVPLAGGPGEERSKHA